MRVLHIGLMVQPHQISGLSKALSSMCELTEISTDTPDLDKHSIDIAQRLNPDLIFIQVQREGVLHIDTFKELSRISSVINWTGDVRSPIPKWYVDAAPYVTTCFSNMTDVVEFKVKGFRSAYIQIGIDESIYNTEGLSIKSSPIIFMGNHYGKLFPLSPHRKDIVDSLQSEFGDMFQLWGEGYKYFNGICNDCQPLEASLYRGSLVGVNVSHFAYERYFSDRMLRMAACGLAIVSHYYPSIEKDWVVSGEECDLEVLVYTDVDDLKKKIRYLLENPLLAKRIGINASNRCMRDYTFTKMAETILRTMPDNILNEGKII